MIRFTIEEAIHLYGESMLGENFPGGNRSKIAISHRVPLGVVLAISPFNYPVNLSAAKNCSGSDKWKCRCLQAGNTRCDQRNQND